MNHSKEQLIQSTPGAGRRNRHLLSWLGSPASKGSCSRASRGAGVVPVPAASRGQLHGGGTGMPLFCQHRQWPSAPAPSCQPGSLETAWKSEQASSEGCRAAGELLWALALLHVRLSSSRPRAALLESQCCLLDLGTAWAGWAWEA